MITRDFVKPGATVIDVGMNAVTDPVEFQRFFAGNAKREETFRKKGSTLIGDVHPEVAEVAGAPVHLCLLSYCEERASDFIAQVSARPLIISPSRVLPTGY